MYTIHVLDKDFSLQGIIDNYESLIWRLSYSDVGDFELYTAVDKKSVELLQQNRYLVRDRDISVDTSGVVTYKNVMIIKNIEIVTDIDEGDHITVTGRELKFILNSRIVWNMTTLHGTAEDGIRKLINNNAINPSNTNRKIPTLTLDDKLGLLDTIEKQITGDKLGDSIVELCTTYNYGWEIYIQNNAFRFRMYTGLDRSYEQTNRPYVLFSDDFNNLYNSEYQLESENYANTTLIGGEGEGRDRIYTTLNDNNSGLNRFEVFTDARDISSKVEDETTLTRTQYINLLKQQGRDTLAEYSVIEGFSGELKTDGNFVYRTDFYIGDKVTVINKYGIAKNVMVLSAIESFSAEEGEKLIPEFNI